MIDLDEKADIIAVLAHQPGGKLLIASKAGYGFIAPEDDTLAQKRGGKQVLNGEMLAMLRVSGDHIATIGENIKTLILPLAELPEMGRGKGVRLQNFKQGGLADVTVFNAEQGPEWADGGGRRRNWPDWKDWLGKRAGAGRQGAAGFEKVQIRASLRGVRRTNPEPKRLGSASNASGGSNPALGSGFFATLCPGMTIIG